MAMDTAPGTRPPPWTLITDACHRNPGSIRDPAPLLSIVDGNAIAGQPLGEALSFGSGTSVKVG